MVYGLSGRETGAMTPRVGERGLWSMVYRLSGSCGGATTPRMGDNPDGPWSIDDSPLPMTPHTRKLGRYGPDRPWSIDDSPTQIHTGG